MAVAVAIGVAIGVVVGVVVGVGVVVAVAVVVGVVVGVGVGVVVAVYMRCAAVGCKRKVRATPFDIVPDGSGQQHLCYRHGWWYACAHPSDYQFTCAAVFPLWSAGDVAVWLTWCGI